MVWIGSLFDQFVGFARANMLSIFEFDADWLFNKDFDQRIQWIRDMHSVFNLKESKIKIYVGVDGDIRVNLEFWNSLLELGCFTGSMVDPITLLFFRCFFEDQVG